MNTVITIIICAVLVILARTIQLCLKRTRVLNEKCKTLFKACSDLNDRLRELEKVKK